MWCCAFLPGLGGVPLGLDLGGFPGRKLSLLKAGKFGASCDKLVTLILTPLPKLSLGAHLSLLYLESLSGSCSLQSSPISSQLLAGAAPVTPIFLTLQ